MANRADGGLANSGSSISASTLEALRQGDQPAWDRMAAAFAPLVFHWSLRAGLSIEDAEDIVQDVFSTVAQRILDFRREALGDTFRGWLYIVTRNKLGNHFRKCRETPRAVGGSEAHHQLQDLVADFGAGLNPDVGIQALCDRVQMLVRSEFNETDWRAFSRVVIDDRTAAEVAAELNISTNSVYLAKSRILRRIREELGEFDG